MAVCLLCHGEGQHDFRDSDAYLQEHLSDEEIREFGIHRELGILECPECAGTGEITEDRHRDLMAAARASVDQIVARIKEGK